MEFVCKDDDGDWYYHSDKLNYARIKNNELRAKISGSQLPDPYLLAQSYKNINPQARSPTDATFKLWEHWNARQ